MKISQEQKLWAKELEKAFEKELCSNVDMLIYGETSNHPALQPFATKITKDSADEIIESGIVKEIVKFFIEREATFDYIEAYYKVVCGKELMQHIPEFTFPIDTHKATYKDFFEGFITQIVFHHLCFKLSTRIKALKDK